MRRTTVHPMALVVGFIATLAVASWLINLLAVAVPLVVLGIALPVVIALGIAAVFSEVDR